MMNWIHRFNPQSVFRYPTCPVPDDLQKVTTIGEEAAPSAVGSTPDEIEDLWQKLEQVYRSGVHPAIQVCVMRHGQVVLNRAIGHASGNAPDDPPDAEKRLIGLDTPVNLFSASKAVTAMLVHKLASQGVLHLDDWVSDIIPEFGRHGKEHMSLRHVLAHRAGLPSLPVESLDLDLLTEPDRVLQLLCDAHLRSRPGRLLAYHAVTGGFILGAVIERATGRDLRDVLRSEIAEPLGLEWLNYGVPMESVSEVALNAYTGPPMPPPFGSILSRALGTNLREIVELSNDPRFITGVIPSANIFTTAREMATFYQCLLDSGMHEGREVFDRRCVRHAVAEQSWWEIDFTLFVPIRYGLGFMLGNRRAGPLGSDNEFAYGHVGLSNIFTFADPERQLSVALLTTGKPILSPHVIPLFGFLNGLGTVFPKIEEEELG